MDTPFTRAIDAGDVERAREVLRSLEVQTVELHPGTLEGTFRLRQPTRLNVIERALRSWEAFDRLTEPDDSSERWEDDLAHFLDATGLVDWGHDHAFVRDRRVAALSSESWARIAAGWTDQETRERTQRARSLGL